MDKSAAATPSWVKRPLEFAVLDEEQAAAASTLRPVVMADSATPADDGPYFVGYGDEWRVFAEWEDAWEHHVMRGSTIGQSHIKVRAEA